MCGGTVQPPPIAMSLQGLSPRVRGNQIRFMVDCGDTWVYPRVCGGTYSGRRGGSVHKGLSPRVRGNHLMVSQAYKDLRSIPACAGEPTSATLKWIADWVYPRVCGGTSSVDRHSRETDGLSPRVRGNQCHLTRDEASPRSIPACAGEPPSYLSSGANARVYPRVCGGTGHYLDVHSSRIGLSPRVRGNLIHPLSHSLLPRSIPACAGEPLGVFGCPVLA